MDIICGVILDGGDTIDGTGEEYLRELVRVASGDKTKNDAIGVGDSEFVPWQAGVFN